MLTGKRKAIFGSLRRGEINKKDQLMEVGVEAGKSKNGQKFLLRLLGRQK